MEVKRRDDENVVHDLDHHALVDMEPPLVTAPRKEVIASGIASRLRTERLNWARPAASAVSSRTIPRHRGHAALGGAATRYSAP